MKGLILLADYFEDIEALATIDLLRRANIKIDIVSITGNDELTTQSLLKIKAEKKYENIDLNEYEFLIIPGGKAVFNTHLSSKITEICVKHFYERGKLIACICAAPSILGKMGILNQLEYTCYPGCEQNMPKQNYLPNEKVVVRNNIITSKAAGTTFLFASKIIECLKGKEEAEKVLKNIYYE